MHPYPESYLDEVIENQGRLFDLVANSYPDKDTRDFIIAFMSGKTWKYMDQGQTYVNISDSITRMRKTVTSATGLSLILPWEQSPFPQWSSS